MLHRRLRALGISVLASFCFLILSHIIPLSPTWLSHPDKMLYGKAVYAQEAGFRLFLPVTQTPGVGPAERPVEKRETSANTLLLELVNQERGRVGCMPLQVDETLATVAQAHSAYSAEMMTMQPAGADGKFADSRLQQAGYPSGYWGENLATSLLSDPPEVQATEIMSRWVQQELESGSSVWLENIRTCQFSQIGIGSSVDADEFLYYWDLLFAGTQPQVPEFVTVDLQKRDDVGRAYRDLYLPTLDVPLDWTGDHETCTAGTASSAYLEALQLQINYFRAMAGVPAVIVFKDEYNQRAHEAALIMSVASQLSHNPTADWECYSEAGYVGASHSNLFLIDEENLSYVIAGYIEDPGPDNSPVGHRRWLLAPDSEVMGSGSVASNPDGKYAGNATYVFSDEIPQWPTNASYRGRVLPATRDNFVAWPPPGYVPQALVYPRWSFSYPYPKVTYEFTPEGDVVVSMNISFAAATVEVLIDDQPVHVTIEHATTGANYATLPTLVWNPSIDWANLDNSRDHEVEVKISNVLIDGEAQDFLYTVKIFNPEG